MLTMWNFLDKRIRRAEFRFGRYAVRNLMTIICAGQLIVFLCSLMFPDLNLYYNLACIRYEIFAGQIWRLFTCFFLPPSAGAIMIVFVLYFYYMVGGALENEWGSFRFDVFYFVGMTGVWISMLLTGYGSSYYLNLSLFLAFAIMYPDYQFMLFFIIPVKSKWLAVADLVMLILAFIFSAGWSAKLAIILSLANIYLFFGKQAVTYIKNEIYFSKTRRAWRQNNRRY